MKLIAQGLEINFYFCKPYHSWERGANENTNGLIRQYIPKGTDFSEITDKEIRRIENILNNRPRKRLGYLTPILMFYSELLNLCVWTYFEDQLDEKLLVQRYERMSELFSKTIKE